MYHSLLEPIYHFLHCKTPDSWLKEAQQPKRLPLLLADHMVCELKAAQTATWLLRKYAVDQASGEALLQWLAPYEAIVYRQTGNLDTLSQLPSFSKKLLAKNTVPYAENMLDKLLRLIKEELHHFYQVLEIIQQRNLTYNNISAGRYAKGLMRSVSTYEPYTLTDKLICAAYIEARSCERFAALIPYLDPTLKPFYISLLRSEARHYQDYLQLAEQISGDDIRKRVHYFGQIEASLIESMDPLFRLHSGIPV